MRAQHSEPLENIPIQARTGTPVSSINLTPPSEPLKKEVQIFQGTEKFINKNKNKINSEEGFSANHNGDITLNFVNADVSDVARIVLGEYLKLNYVIDGTIQGTVTLETSQPLDRNAVLPVLEAAFRLSGLALLRTESGYRISPLSEAAKGTAFATSGTANRQPGYGVEIIPLHFIGAGEMQRLLEPMMPSGSILRIDPVRNLLIISGTAQERSAIAENVSLFDVDALSGMSIGLYPLKSSDAKIVSGQLEKLLSSKDGPLSGVIKIMPIPKQNSILVMSPQPKYLDSIKSIIERFDQVEDQSERRIYVYYVQNGRASSLANILTKLLIPGQSTSVEEQQTQDQSVATGRGIGQSGDLSAPVSASQQGSTVAGFGGTSPVAGRRSSSDSTPITVSQPLDQSAGLDAVSPQAVTQAGPRIIPDNDNNALLIMANASEYAMIEKTLTKVDIAPLQVLLETAVAEVTLTNNLRYGVQYLLKSGKGDTISLSGSGSLTPLPTTPGFNYLLTAGSTIRSALSALEDLTTLKVVSAPQVLVLNNQTAKLEVGDQVPIATQSAVSITNAGAPIVNTIEFRDTGVILSVTPRVNDGGLVLMDIAQEVSDVAPTTTSTLNSPTIQQRKIRSTIAVQDGETVALGGLIRDNNTTTKSGIPLLEDIPFLGAAFSAQEIMKTRTELIVLITPHVVQGIDKLRDLTKTLKERLSNVRDIQKLFP